MASRQYTISTPVNPNCFLNSCHLFWYLYYSTGEPLVPSRFLCQFFPGSNIIDFLLGIKRNIDSSGQLLIMEGLKAQTILEQQLSTINPTNQVGGSYACYCSSNDMQKYHLLPLPQLPISGSNEVLILFL